MTHPNSHTEAEHSAQDALELAMQELLDTHQIPPDFHLLAADRQRLYLTFAAAGLECRRGNRAPLAQLRREGHF